MCRVKLSNSDRADIRKAIYEGLGWHDVAVSLGLTTAYDYEKRAAVRNYYFNMAKVIHEVREKNSSTRAV